MFPASTRAPFRLRRQAFDDPHSIGAPVAQAIVQPVRPSLPELDRIRRHDVAAPVRGPGYFLVEETLLHLAHCLVQFMAIGDRLALTRYPRRELMAARAIAKIAIRFPGGAPYHRARDANLALERRSEEGQSGAGIFGQVMAFAALVVGEECEAPLVHHAQ
jgi:hypothetical protein